MAPKSHPASVISVSALSPEFSFPVSTCPAGQSYPLPEPEDYESEFTRLQKLIAEQRPLGLEIAVIDCFGMLDDRLIRRHFELGCEVKDLGRGHTKCIKDELPERK